MFRLPFLALLAFALSALPASARADAAPTPGDSRYPSSVLLERVPSPQNQAVQARPQAREPNEGAHERKRVVHDEQPIGSRATQTATHGASDDGLPSLAAPRLLLTLGVLLGTVGTVTLGGGILLALAGWGADLLVPAGLGMMAVSALIIGSSVYWLRKRRRERAVTSEPGAQVQKIDAATSCALSFRLHGRGAQLQLTF